MTYQPEQSKKGDFLFFTKLMLVTLVIASILVAIYTIEILFLAFAGVLFAIFLRSITDFLKRKLYLSDGLALLLTLFTLLALTFLILFLLAPILTQQLTQLITELPESRAF